jgi:hypothetical protein
MGTYEVLPRASAPPKRALFMEKCRSLLHQPLSFDHRGFFRSCPRQGQNMTKSRILCTCFYRLLVTFWLRGMWCSLRSPFRWCRKLEPLGNNTIPSNCIQFCPMVSNCIQFFPIIQLWEARFFFSSGYIFCVYWWFEISCWTAEDKIPEVQRWQLELCLQQWQ